MVEKTGLEAELSVPDHVLIPSRARAVKVEVLATLRNHDEVARAVHVTNSGDVHFWHLLDDRHKEVQRAPAAAKVKGLESARTETIAGGQVFAEPRTVALDATKLKDGRCYTLRYVLWGEHTAQGRIHFSHAPAKPAKAKAKSVRAKAAKGEKK